MNDTMFFIGCFSVIGLLVFMLLLLKDIERRLSKKIAYIVDTEKKVDELLKLMSGKVKKDVNL